MTRNGPKGINISELALPEKSVSNLTHLTVYAFHVPTHPRSVCSTIHTRASCNWVAISMLVEGVAKTSHCDIYAAPST